MAVFDPTKGGGLVLKSYGSQSILADPAQEMVRLPQITFAVRELATGLKSLKEKVRYSMSGQSVFTRFIKLPPLDEDNIDELVKFEAQQHVPFPIDEVVWDWQLLDSTGPEKEVALVAIKDDALTEINETVAEAGLGTKEVDAAPMALYNAFRYNYPEVVESVLLMDVGAKATNLVYIEGNRLFTRSIAVGAASITTAISKEYNITFAEAEAQKVTNGMVSLGGGHTEQLDEAAAQLATVIRNALNRLPAEVARTNNYYRSQHDGTAPTKVYLAGGGANLPYLSEFLEEKLRVPIELFNPLQRVSVGKAIDVEQLGLEAHMIGELVGLALRGIGKAPIKIDLVPEVVASERATAQRKPFLLAASVILLTGVGVWWMHQSSLAATAAAKRSEMEVEKSKLQGPANKIDSLTKSQVQLKGIGESYSAEQEMRTRWFEVLDKVKDYFNHQDVWITDFEPVGLYQIGDPKSAKPRVKQNFASIAYGTSVLDEFKRSYTPEEEKTSRSRSRRGPAAPVAATAPKDAINAIRITGFWKEAPRSVTEIVEKIKKDHDSPDAIFTLKKPGDPQGKDLSSKEILPVFKSSIGDPNELAEQFIMMLPLKSPISIK
jgi:type IV pilus assembly protein PilM